jgi:hypothetical protein
MSKSAASWKEEADYWCHFEHLRNWHSENMWNLAASWKPQTITPQRLPEKCMIEKKKTFFWVAESHSNPVVKFLTKNILHTS